MIPLRGVGVVNSLAGPVILHSIPGLGGFIPEPRRGSGGKVRGLRAVCCAALLLLCAPAFALTDCGSLERDNGPWDYNDHSRSTRGRLAIVERVHFTQEIATLRRPVASLAGNLNYTLGNFPNHHRALDAISRLSAREGAAHLRNAPYSTDCYFERAVRWRPLDPVVRLVFAIHHFRFGRLEAAIAEARRGLELAPNHVELHYNLGLFLVRKGEYEAARRHAREAYRRGYALPGLRQQLERVGEWRD